MKPGTLCVNDTLLKLFLGHISDTMTFFGRPENETIGDSNQFLRYNFCVTVKCVAQDLKGQEDRISKVCSFFNTMTMIFLSLNSLVGSEKASLFVLATLDSRGGVAARGRNKAHCSTESLIVLLLQVLTF